MAWKSHTATYVCTRHDRTARARRWKAFQSKAPRCAYCRIPMILQDQAGLTEQARHELHQAWSKQTLTGDRA